MLSTWLFSSDTSTSAVSRPFALIAAEHAMSPNPIAPIVFGKLGLAQPSGSIGWRGLSRVNSIEARFNGSETAVVSAVRYSAVTRPGAVWLRGHAATWSGGHARIVKLNVPGGDS